MMTVMLPEPTFPRLSVRLLPPYRYLLDEGPHPRRHPEGYAHGKPAPECGSEAQRLEAGRWWECAEYCWGVDLYNHGYWWEAHEAWEGVWACFALDHALRHALQCLIQVSAAHLQRAREILAGAQSLIQRSQRHLADSQVGDGMVAGLRLSAWWHVQVKPYFGDATAGAYPFLRPGVTS